MKGDHHTCPAKQSVTTKKANRCCGTTDVTTQIDHVGGPVIGPCSPNVKVNNVPAARCGDNLSCEAEPKVDMIVTGPATVKINNRLAAAIGSKTQHLGVLDATGSPNVKYSDVFAGATFGNSDAATKACQEAAKNRKKYGTDANGTPLEPGSNVPHNEQQGKAMNCGQESARTACIQRCNEGKLPPEDAKKACGACNTTEDQWYADYLEKQRESHNKSAEAENERITKANDALWAKSARDIGCVTDSGQFKDAKVLDVSATWHGHEGITLFFWSTEKPQVTTKWYANARFEPLVQPILPPDDPKAAQQRKDGELGSTAESRQALMQDSCGVKSELGQNSETDMGGQLADGKTVIAVVDVGTLHGEEPQGRHAVAVSEMKYNDKGELEYVVINDTSQPKACGNKLTGKNAENFQKALTPGAQTNVY